MSRKLFRKMVTPVAVSMMLAQASGYVRAALPGTFKLVDDLKDGIANRFYYPLTRFCAESGNDELAACKSPSDCLAKIKEMMALGENDDLAYGWLYICRPDGEYEYCCVLYKYDKQQNDIDDPVRASSQADVNAAIFVELPPDVLAAVKDQLLVAPDFYNPGNDNSKKEFLEDLKYYEYLARGKTIGKWTVGGLTASGAIGYAAKSIYDAYGNPTPKSMVENRAVDDDESTDAEDDDDDD